MKFLFSLLLVSFCCATTSFAQQNDTTYYSKYWNKTDKEHAAYFGVCHFDGKLYQERDYYIGGQLQMTGAYINKLATRREGTFIYYYENGQKSEEDEYTENKKIGTWKEYASTGRLTLKAVYNDGLNRAIFQYDSVTGKKRLERYYNNSGNDSSYTGYYITTGKTKIHFENIYKLHTLKFFLYYPNGRLREKRTITYPKKIFEVQYDAQGRKTKVTTFTTAPVFSDSLQTAIGKYLVKDTPIVKSGAADVHFAITKDLLIKNIHIDGENDLLNDEIAHAIHGLTLLKPATFLETPSDCTIYFSVHIKDKTVKVAQITFEVD